MAGIVNAALHLGNLAAVNPDKFVELYKKGLNDGNWQVVLRTASSLKSLIGSLNFIFGKVLLYSDRKKI